MAGEAVVAMATAVGGAVVRGEEAGQSLQYQSPSGTSAWPTQYVW